MNRLLAYLAFSQTRLIEEFGTHMICLVDRNVC